MRRSFRLKGCKDARLLAGGTAGSITLLLEDESEPEIELLVRVPDVLGALVGRLLQIANSSPRVDVVGGFVPITPQKIAVGLGSAGNAMLSFQFGQLHLNLPIPAADLRGVADFLSEHARTACSDPPHLH